MDTGTHFIVGIGLAGLAYIDPIVAGSATTAAAVFFGTVIGSQIPDADTLIRLKSNAAYIRNHRGMSHSIPAQFLWTFLISITLYAIFQPPSFWHLALWVWIAVALHVVMDLFNTYGTQGARPFSKRWISWNIIHIFDPVLFTSHLIALIYWVSGYAEPQVIFPILYAGLFVYYIWRVLAYMKLIQQLRHEDGSYEEGDKYLAIPTVRLTQWNIVKIGKNNLYTLGEWKGKTLYWFDTLQCVDHPAVDKSKEIEDIQAFLSFSPHACAECIEHNFGYEVRWVDVRYRHRKQYPFVAVALYSHDLQLLDSYTGWLSGAKLEKKLRFDTF